jgi:glycosyltransferase involved in cell wall biosynthesis
MRLAVLNWRDQAHPRAGGAEVFVHEVARRWAASGHDVTLYASRIGSLPREDSVDGVRIVRVGRLRDGSHHLLAPSRVRTDGPDAVVESVNTIPYELPLRSKKRFPPYLTLVHQMAVDVWDAHLPFPAAALAKWIEPLLFRPYRNASVAAVSESTAEDLRKAGIHSPIVVPQGGIGPQSPLPKEKAPTVIFVGRLAANKRPDHAIEAFRLVRQSIPEARMWIVGEGPMRDRLAANLPEGAEMLGRLPRDELLDRMSRAHLLVATSVREGWGLVVTEANALGTPAVAYDVPGLRDSVKDSESGRLVPLRPGNLATACIELLTDQVAYVRLAQAAAQWGARFDWNRTSTELLDHLSRTRSTKLRSSIETN